MLSTQPFRSPLIFCSPSGNITSKASKSSQNLILWHPSCGYINIDHIYSPPFPLQIGLNIFGPCKMSTFLIFVSRKSFPSDLSSLESKINSFDPYCHTTLVNHLHVQWETGWHPIVCMWCHVNT